MKKNFIIISIIFISIFLHSYTHANNIRVTGTALTGQNMALNFTYVQFNLDWDNSWRDNINWDAAWVFVKYRTSYDTTWKQAHINSNPDNHWIPSGYTTECSSENTGLMLYRNAAGSGNSSLSGVELMWDYGLNNVNDADQVQVKVFAIEMVYVSAGGFYLGDGTVNGTYMHGQFHSAGTVNPLFIQNENAVILGGTLATSIGNHNNIGLTVPDDFSSTAAQTLPAAFPKGTSAFYCMKYEISQGQYTEFLNTLTRTQQKTRVGSDISGDAVTNVYVMSNTAGSIYRTMITCPGIGNGTTQPVVFSCTRPDRACNYLSWPDGCAYMDWAGLRPMTEMEFEKSCRGPLAPVADEFAWALGGYNCLSGIIGTENGTETAAGFSNCNLWFSGWSGGDGGQGPVRCGLFATSSTDRVYSGASYYGIMELSGNVFERCVSIGSSSGRTFLPVNGDGTLNAVGNASISNWPGGAGGEVTGAAGSMFRGGSYFTVNVGSFPYHGRVSDRTMANWNANYRSADYGFRGVRSSTIVTDYPGKKERK